MAKKAKKKATTKKASAGVKARTKSAIYTDLADGTGLSRKQVASVFEGMAGLIKKDLSTRGPGTFTVPGLLKIKVVRKPATKSRPGVNPFTGENIMIKAKPARRVVKALPLKGLKDLL